MLTRTVVDHRTLPRRRGEVLERAIFDAALQELCTIGIHRMTLESVARRASTGNTTLYRRWSNKYELLTDALAVMPTETRSFTRTGPLREDLIRFLRNIVDESDEVRDRAIRSLLGEADHYPDLLAIYHRRVTEPRRRRLSDFLRNAAARGELDEARLSEEVLMIIPAAIHDIRIIQGRQVTPRLITNLVDRVLMPLLTGDSPSRVG